MIGIFSYRENVERQARMQARLERLERKLRPTDEELAELEHLRDSLAELEHWLREWQRL